MKRALYPVIIISLAIVFAGCTVTTRTTRTRSQGSGTTVQQGGENTVETSGGDTTTQGDESQTTVQGAATPQNQNAAPVEPVVIEQPAVEEIPVRQSRPTRIGHRAAQGAPEVTRGEAIAFWVWYDDAGWHVRTTSDTEVHTFQGAIQLNGGEFENLAPVNTNHRDRWTVNEEGRLHFAFRTRNGMDGLDFQTQARCVRLNLRVDGEGAASVRTGAEATEAGDHVIRICPR